MFTKVCTICKTPFTVRKIENFSKYFYKEAKGKHQHNSRCRTCCSNETKKLRKKHPEKFKSKKPSKARLANCVVCQKEFLARCERTLCCSKECSKVKNTVRRKLNSRLASQKRKEKVKKEIEKSTVRHKRYTLEEKSLIVKYLNLNFSYEDISEKLGRTPTGISKISRKLNKLLPKVTPTKSFEQI